MDIQVGDTLRMKKAHPCGSARWEVLRIGADFRLRCLGCGREVMGPRSRFERNVRQIERETAQTPEPADTQEPPQGFQKRGTTGD